MTSQDTPNDFPPEVRASVDRMFANVQEVIGLDHLAGVLSGSKSHGDDSIVRAYIGLEPSGKAHLGWVILAETIRNMLSEGVNVLILLADWHAWVNDKFGRDMEKISVAGEYMAEVFRVLAGSQKKAMALVNCDL